MYYFAMINNCSEFLLVFIVFTNEGKVLKMHIVGSIINLKYGDVETILWGIVCVYNSIIYY